MTRPHNYGWRHVGQPTADKTARLAALNASIDEMCKYRDQCLRFAAEADRRIARLQDEQFALVEALKAPEVAGKTGV